MDDKRREYLQQQHQAIHGDVETLASRVQDLLASFGVPDDKAAEVYGDIIATGDTLLAAYTAAIEVAEQALRKSDKREDEVQKLTKEVEKLTKTLERNEKLAVLRDHIKLFRIDIAYKMHFGSWDALADKLYYESKGKRSSKPTHALLETTLTDNHLSMKLWNEVKEVADARNSEFHKGKALDPKDVMQLLSDKWLPDDLVHTKHSLDQMLQFIDEEIAC